MTGNQLFQNFYQKNIYHVRILMSMVTVVKVDQGLRFTEKPLKVSVFKRDAFETLGIYQMHFKEFMCLKPFGKLYKSDGESFLRRT